MVQRSVRSAERESWSELTRKYPNSFVLGSDALGSFGDYPEGPFQSRGALRGKRRLLMVRTRRPPSRRFRIRNARLTRRAQNASKAAAAPHVSRVNRKRVGPRSRNPLNAPLDWEDNGGLQAHGLSGDGSNRLDAMENGSHRPLRG